MLPDIPQMRDSLAALIVEEVDDARPSRKDIVICDKLKRTHPDKSVQYDETQVVLRQSGSPPISLDTLVDRVASELKHAGHTHFSPTAIWRSSLASLLIGAATVLRKSKEDSLGSLNQIVTKIVPARVTQWAVFLNPTQDFSRYAFGSFTYSVFDTDLLRNRCERAGSNYAELYMDRLRGRLALCRDGRSIKVANIKQHVRTLKSPPRKSLAYRLLDEYFRVVSAAEQGNFASELEHQQAVYGAAGLGTMSVAFANPYAWWTEWITVFDMQQRHCGWVVPTGIYPILSATEPTALACGYADISQELRVVNWGSKELDDHLQTYCNYLNAAKTFDFEGRREESLLHLVCALDFLLGGKAEEALTFVLAERVAMLSHLALKQDFETVVRFVKNTYDMRSGYVHRGERGKPLETKGDSLDDRLERLKGITRVVLGAACFARNQSWSDVSSAREVWLGRIDILRTKVKIGQGLDPNDVQDLGLDRVELAPGGVPSVHIRWTS
jgi:hypothetical protein